MNRKDRVRSGGNNGACNNMLIAASQAVTSAPKTRDALTQGDFHRCICGGNPYLAMPTFGNGMVKASGLIEV